MWEMIFLALFWGVSLFYLFGGCFLGKTCMPCVIPSFYQSHSNKPWCVWISILFKSLSNSILHHSSFELPELMIIPNMVVSINGGTQKWMVSVRDNPIRKWMRTGGTQIRKPPYVGYLLDSITPEPIICQSWGNPSDRSRFTDCLSAGPGGFTPNVIPIYGTPQKKDREGHSYKTY